MKRRLAAIAGLVLSLGGLMVATGKQATANEAEPPTVWYNCLTREVWSPEKQAWCNQVQRLENAEYTIPDVGTIPLSMGQYRNDDEQIIANLMNREGLITFGDLNGDGVDDAVSLIMVNTGGSGNFVFLSAFDMSGDTPINVSTVFLGDRVNVKSVRIADAAVNVNMITQGPDDPFCCPTLEVNLVYELQPQLVLTSDDIPTE